jgi:hypothetical protein
VRYTGRCLRVARGHEGRAGGSPLVAPQPCCVLWKCASQHPTLSRWPSRNGGQESCGIGGRDCTLHLSGRDLARGPGPPASPQCWIVRREVSGGGAAHAVNLRGLLGKTPRRLGHASGVRDRVRRDLRAVPKLDPARRCRAPEDLLRRRAIYLGDERRETSLKKLLDPANAIHEIPRQLPRRSSAYQDQEADLGADNGRQFIRLVANALVVGERHPTSTANLREPHFVLLRRREVIRMPLN